MWVKARKPSGAEVQDWVVYHKGLNGGSNPADWRIYLNKDNAQNNQGVSVWNSTMPDSRYFTLGTDADTNDDAGNYYEYMCYLFASVDGIRKCGYYAGSNAVQTITTGFQPRFVIIRNITESADWWVLDTFRGWGAGNDQGLRINADTAQYSFDFGAGPTSTGFSLVGNDASVNAASKNYIYYAHA